MQIEDWPTARKNLDAVAAQHRAAVTAAKTARAAAVAAAHAVDHYTAAAALVRDVAAQVQRLAHARLAAVVTDALADVFGDEAYRFEIVFEEKRGRTTAMAVFTRDGHTYDPLGATGGGPVDVAAFALRLVSVALARPARRRVLVLDEPFKFVNHRVQPALVDMLDRLASELDFQIIMVTHIPGLVCGTVHEIAGRE